MPDDAVRLINTTPSSTPRSKTEIHIFAVCRRKEPIKTAQFNELVSVNSHEATRGKQCVTGLLMLRIEFPAIKAVFKLQARRTTRNRRSIPIIAPRRDGKNIGRFEMPYQRSQEIWDLLSNRYSEARGCLRSFSARASYTKRENHFSARRLSGLKEIRVQSKPHRHRCFGYRGLQPYRCPENFFAAAQAVGSKCSKCFFPL